MAVDLLPRILRTQLAAYGRARRSVALKRHVCLFLGSLLAGTSALFLADYGMDLPPEVRAGLLASFLLLLALLLLGLIARQLREDDPSELAISFERRSGLPFKNTLVSSVELSSSSDADRHGYSMALVQACAEEAARLCFRAEPWKMPDTTAFRSASRSLGWTALVSLAIFAVGSDAVIYIANRYSSSLLGTSSQGPVLFRVSPGDARIAEGGELLVKLTLEGTGRFPVMLKGDKEERVSLRHGGKRDGLDSYSVRLTGLTRSFAYRFEAGPFRSPVYRVTVVRPPSITELRVRYHYPDYMGLSEDVQEDGSGDLVAPVGTRIELQGTASADLTSATLILDGTRHVSMRQPSPRRFAHQFTPDRSGTYRIELMGGEGFGNQPVTHHISVIDDRPPLVYILEPGHDLSLAVVDVTSIPVEVFSSDDYGIVSMTLKYRLTQRFEYTFLTSDHEEPLVLPEGETKKVTLEALWDLRQRVFQPGDLITYHVEATDARPGAEPHVGRSKSYSIRIPYLRDVYEEAAEEQDEQISTVEELARKQNEIDEKLARAMKDIRQREGKVDWKTKQNLETLSKKQQRLRKEAEDLASRMDATFEKMQKNDVVDAGTLEKLKEVQELFNEVADGRMKQLMEQMRDLMGQTQLDPNAMKQAQKKFDKERYARELDRVLASLKKLRVQQELDRAVESAEELAEQQDRLRQETARRLKEGKPVADLAEKQQELAEQTSKLLDRMDDLAKQARDPFPEAAERIEEASKRARDKQVEKDTSEAASDLGQEKGEQAQAKQNQALNKMRELQDDLIQTRAGMKQKQVQVNLQKLLSLVRNGLEASHLQEKLIDSASMALPVNTRLTSRSLAATQNRVYRGLTSFERDFDGLIADEVLFKSAFVRAVSELIETSREAVDAFEATHIHSGRQLAGRSLESVNRIVAKLIEMVQQLMNQQQSASMEGFFDQLEKLVKQQQRINDQAERLQQMPSSNPMLQQMMQRMAAEQAMVRQSMEQLAEKYSEARELTGDLEALAKEMKEVEEALEKYGLSDGTVQKQKKILYRMLEAEKSIHKQGESRKRKAKIAREYSPRQVDPVQSELTEVRQRMFDNVNRTGYPIEYRDLVESYLQSIAR